MPFDSVVPSYNRGPLSEFFDDPVVGPYWSSRHNYKFNMASDIGEVENTVNKFAIKLDVSHFKPEELNINLEGRVLTIEGHHDTKTDFGFTKRSFTRQFTLPEDVNLAELHSQLNKEGHLAIDVPKKNAEKKNRQIPIHTPSGQKI